MTLPGIGQDTNVAVQDTGADDGQQSSRRGTVGFGAERGPGGDLAALYAYSQIDRLFDLARFVAHDFFARPDTYVTLADPSLDKALAALYFRSGTEEALPSRGQRQAIFRPLFGDGDPDSTFVRSRDKLLVATAVYAEWAQPTGMAAIEENIRSMHRSFRSHLVGVSGASAVWSRWNSLRPLAENVAYPVLRDRCVAGAFRVSTAPRVDWPYREDTNGDKLVAEIGRQLDPESAAAYQRFGDHQRIAMRGAEAISAVVALDPDDGDDESLRRMIVRCYTWYSALGNVLPHDPTPTVPSARPSSNGASTPSANGAGDPRLPGGGRPLPA